MDRYIRIETCFDHEMVPDEMPSDDDLLRLGRRLMVRAMEAKRSRAAYHPSVIDGGEYEHQHDPFTDENGRPFPEDQA